MNSNIQVDPDYKNLGQAFLNALSKAGVKASLRIGNEVVWKNVSANLDYLPVNYSVAMIDYQSAYWTGIGCPTLDISIVLFHDAQPCGIWPLSVTKDTDGKMRIGSNGVQILPPLFLTRFAKKSLKSATAACVEALEDICQQIQQTSIASIEANPLTASLSYWHDQLMQRGGRAEIGHELFLDLTPPLAEIKSSFRKSYKSLIVSGSKLWNVKVATADDPNLWNEFRTLHREVAGRITRDEESWRNQRDAMASGNAFFVYLRDTVERMVGGGLFYNTNHEALYAVGVYDRLLFDKPLGHVVQYHAINEMKRRGLKWYKLGTLSYTSDLPEPSEKEVTIANFKKGFASHIFPCFKLNYESKKLDINSN